MSLPIHPFLNWWAGQAMPVGISEGAWVAGKRICDQKCCKTTGIFIVYLTESLEIRSPVLAPCYQWPQWFQAVSFSLSVTLRVWVSSISPSSCKKASVDLNSRKSVHHANPQGYPGFVTGNPGFSLPLFFFFGCTAWHMGFISTTRDGTYAPCSGSSEPLPWDCQGFPFFFSPWRKDSLKLNREFKE